MKKILQSIVILTILLFGTNCVRALEENNYNVPSSISSIEYVVEDSTLGKSEKSEVVTKDTPNSGTSYATVSCGGVDDIPAALPVLFSNVINIVKIAVPIILIIMGMLDFGKAVTSQDEKTMKESQTKFVKRIIGSICVFLVITIVQFAFRVINVDDSNNILACIDCFVNNDCHMPKNMSCKDMNVNYCKNSATCAIYTKSNGEQYCDERLACNALSIERCSESSECEITGDEHGNPTCQPAKAECSKLDLSACSERSDCKIVAPSGSGTPTCAKK